MYTPFYDVHFDTDSPYSDVSVPGRNELEFNERQKRHNIQKTVCTDDEIVMIGANVIREERIKMNVLCQCILERAGI